MNTIEKLCLNTLDNVDQNFDYGINVLLFIVIFIRFFDQISNTNTYYRISACYIQMYSIQILHAGVYFLYLYKIENFATKLRSNGVK
jgi:hypothetical protein